MNTKQIEKSLNRLKELENFIDDNSTYKNIPLYNKLSNEWNEIKFKLNKQNVNFILKGKAKYYYGNQCALFTSNLLKYGYGYISKTEIEKNGISFNKYSINNGSNQYCRDIKQFSNTQELLGFVIGYNQSISNLNIE
jgi:hypothetical protein|tara:strand:- start:137 stop:547 length:411 start_codon:yes stop_codon:yes gene_type:complete